MAESNVPGQGPLLGWNKAQDAISALARNVDSLNKGLSDATQKIKTLGAGAGGFVGGVWGSTGTQPYGPSTYNQTVSNNARARGLLVNDVWNGSSNSARYVNNGGRGSTPGGSGGGRMGGGAANNGGYTLKGGVRGFVNWSQGKLDDQVAMQTTAYQAAQYSSQSWSTLRNQAFKNNFTAQSTADAAQAYSILAAQGMSPGTGSFNTQWNYAKGTAGYLNPDMSQTARAVGTAAAWNAGTYNTLRGFGIATIQNGQKQSPRQIAQQIYNRFPELKQIKTQQQLSATLNDPTSGLNQSLNSWGLDPNTLELVKGELRGMLLAQTHGGSMQAYVSTANQRDSGKTQEAKNSALSQLNKWGIGGSLANDLMTRSGTLRNQDVNINDAFTSGLKDATSALDAFSTALQKVLQTTGADSVLGYSGGAGSMLGGALSSGLTGYGIARGLGSVFRLGGTSGGGGGGSGLLARLGLGADAGGAAGAAGGSGLLGSLGGAAMALAPFLLGGYEIEKNLDPNHKTITGKDTRGMSFGGWMKDTFSWTAIKRNLNPFYVLGSHNDGQGGGAGGGGSSSVSAAGSGNSKSAATGTQGAGKTAAAVIQIAMKYLGVKYVWGGNSPKGFDCSGLIQYSFKQIGVSLPRVASQQQKAGKPVKLGTERAGDLLFVGDPAHHVVMCIGNGKIIEAPHTGASVRVRSYSPGEFTNAVRILGSVGSMGDLTNANSDTAGSDSNRLSTMGFGGDVGAYGSTEEVEAIAAGISSIGAANVGSGNGAGQSGTTTTNNGTNAGGPLPTGNLKSWIKSALGILNQDTSSNERYVNTMAMNESSGNPRAVNLTDSNAKAGHPSKGLLQTIDSTFNAYSIKGHKDIWNPVDNIIAGVRYAESRYGSLANVPGIKSLANGGSYKGYAVGSTNIDVDQTARVHKGEMIIPAYQADAIRKALAGNTPMAAGVGGLHTSGGKATLQFNSGAIVIQVQGVMDAQSARDAAQQFMSALAEDHRINLIAAGN